MNFNLILYLSALYSIAGLSVEDENPSDISKPDLFKGLKWPEDISKFVERIVGEWVLDNPDQLPEDANKYLSQLNVLYNAPDAPCNARYWNQTLKGYNREGESTIYTNNSGEKVEVKRSPALANCEILTTEINPNRLVFYFKDDKCKEFDYAKCQ